MENTDSSQHSNWHQTPTKLGSQHDLFIHRSER